MSHMPNNRLHIKLWRLAFGNCGFPFVPVDSQMDEYSQVLPGIKHRREDHDPLRAGDYEDPEPQMDKWRIVYRFYHIAVDWWWTRLSKEERVEWRKKIKNGYYPFAIDRCFWEIIDAIAKNPLSIYEILPWECNPLPPGWKKYIISNHTK
jgi:hypothetical protein